MIIQMPTMIKLSLLTVAVAGAVFLQQGCSVEGRADLVLRWCRQASVCALSPFLEFPGHAHTEAIFDIVSKWGTLAKSMTLIEPAGRGKRFRRASLEADAAIAASARRSQYMLDKRSANPQSTGGGCCVH